MKKKKKAKQAIHEKKTRASIPDIWNTKVVVPLVVQVYNDLPVPIEVTFGYPTTVDHSGDKGFFGAGLTLRIAPAKEQAQKTLPIEEDR